MYNIYIYIYTLTYTVWWSTLSSTKHRPPTCWGWWIRVLGQVSRFNADTTGVDCNRSEGKVSTGPVTGWSLTLTQQDPPSTGLTMNGGCKSWKYRLFIDVYCWLTWLLVIFFGMLMGFYEIYPLVIEQLMELTRWGVILKLTLLWKNGVVIIYLLLRNGFCVHSMWKITRG